jgi:SAM-dependent methyltransferase
MQRPEWAPDDVDMDTPSPARVYDALLGGSHNFEVDRAAAAHGSAMMPDLPVGAAAHRRFLRRAVTFLAEAGIRQLVDVGAGIPTVGNTHEIAQRHDPGNRVVYVDIHAVAVAHATAILEGTANTAAVRGDVRTPEALLADLGRTRLIDLDEPVGLLMVALLHLLPDTDAPAAATAALRDAVAPGSHLVISHLTSERSPEQTARLSSEVARRDRVSLVFRPRSGIAVSFGGFPLVPPAWSTCPSGAPTRSSTRRAGPPARCTSPASAARSDRPCRGPSRPAPGPHRGRRTATCRSPWSTGSPGGGRPR